MGLGCVVAVVVGMSLEGGVGTAMHSGRISVGASISAGASFFLCFYFIAVLEHKVHFRPVFDFGSLVFLKK